MCARLNAVFCISITAFFISRKLLLIMPPANRKIDRHPAFRYALNLYTPPSAVALSLVKRRFANCLAGRVSPPIGEALTDDAFQGILGTLCIIDAERGKV